MTTKAQKRPIRILLLVGDRIGANCMMGGKKLSIIDTFRHYGWDVTLTGLSETVSPCPYAAKLGATPVTIDRTIDTIEDVTVFDVVSVLPGPSHQQLIASEHALVLIRVAYQQGLVVSGWCRGVRVLAAADVVRGRRVVGHADDRDAIETAGGTFVGQDHPPIIDGTLVTGARSYYYRAENADAINQAALSRQNP
jgi:putative intracellular protease/amidase